MCLFSFFATKYSVLLYFLIYFFTGHFDGRTDPKSPLFATSLFEERCIRRKGQRQNCREILARWFMADYLQAHCRCITGYLQSNCSGDFHLILRSNKMGNRPTERPYGQTLIQRCVDASTILELGAFTKFDNCCNLRGHVLGRELLKQIRIHNGISHVPGAGTLLEVRLLFGLNSAVKNRGMERRTEQRTDGQTDPHIESRKRD